MENTVRPVMAPEDKYKKKVGGRRRRKKKERPFEMQNFSSFF